MGTVRKGAYCILFGLAVILLTTPTQTSAAGPPVGPLFDLQQQINNLQAQINAMKPIDMASYFPVTEGKNFNYKATRFIKTPTFTASPYNVINGTLTIDFKYEGATLVIVWEEIYDPNTTIFPASPPAPIRMELLYDIKPEGIVETGYRFIPLSGPNSGKNTSTTNYDPGLLTFPSGWYGVGDMWGGAYNEEFFIVRDPTKKQYMSRLYQYAIVGIETVTVPAGTFTDCIKIARFRGNQSDRIGWYAKGIGPEKFIFTHPDQTVNNTLNGMYELQSYSIPNP
jgi:hypothetical protein